MKTQQRNIVYFSGMALLIQLSLAGCAYVESVPPPFELLRGNETGLKFENKLEQSAAFNVFNYMYFFNGGGLGAGDFNNDGLIDLYFTSNMGTNALYLNEGELRFRDITEAAGVAGTGGWKTGVSVVDINNDGLLDIYVNQMGDYPPISGRNQLFVNQGIEAGVPVFRDEAARYGLDLVSFGTQAAFFDYDLDGDLDMFQLNHSLHDNGTFGQRKSFAAEDHLTAGDRLLRNDDGRFVDVTKTAGLNSTVIGYGLGIVTGDVNQDGWPDIYIGNDFHENDYLYINQQDGTFREVLTEQLMHTSRFSMGVDMGDINNDGFSEIYSLDMMPEDPFILKTSLGEDDYSVFQFKLSYGYNHQYARNNLQLNNGNGTFSEIGVFAGVHASDWSWAPLLVDFDNDGFKDIFVSNGIPRRMNDIDYINYRTSDEVKWKFQTRNIEEQDLVVVDKMPKIKLPNKFYLNTHDLRFRDITDQVAGGDATFSNGAVYADLDNDGDLDIVVNNLEDEPFVYRNRLHDQPFEGRNYLSLQLAGPAQNRDAIGSRVAVFKGEQKVVQERFAVRGFQSSMLGPLHVGVGATEAIDSILLIWPDQTYEKLSPDLFNRRAELSWRPGLPRFDFRQLQRTTDPEQGFADITAATGLQYEHEENPFIEFHREGLIPHMVSTAGPAVAVGDINGDGLTDIFLGSAKRERSRLYVQTPAATFVERPATALWQDSIHEEVDAAFVDIDRDGDLDLVTASGGNEYQGTEEPRAQCLYLNDGRGNFQRKADAFEGVFLTASCVLPADFNGDGWVDLFFGGRAVPWKYGLVPNSYLLLNRGNGTFEDVTQRYATTLSRAGLVKGGQWADMDADGDPDLVLALEWGPVTVYRNDGEQFVAQPLSDDTGWWNFVLPGDFDQDGDMDVVAGNLGLNSKLQASPEQPLRLYVNDYDDNEQVEPILTYHLAGKELPFANFAEVTKQLPSLKKRYLYSQDFARASLTDLFGAEKLDDAVKHQATTLRSMYFEKQDDGRYLVRPLPDALQLSPLMAGAVLTDEKGRGSEIILGGNFYENNIEMGRYDADYGHVLRIDPQGGFAVRDLGGVSIRGQVRYIRALRVGGRQCYLVVRNDEAALILRPQAGGQVAETPLTAR